MSRVILSRDHRGLGKYGEEYACPNDEVAAKLIRLGHGVAAGEELPPATEPVTRFEDLQAQEDEALLARAGDADDLDDEGE